MILFVKATATLIYSQQSHGVRVQSNGFVVFHGFLQQYFKRIIDGCSQVDSIPAKLC